MAQKKTLNDAFLTELRDVNRKVQSGEIKVCAKCGQAKDLGEFRDRNLATKYGRLCRECKGYRLSTYLTVDLRTPRKSVEQSLTKSEHHRVENFVKSPEKYATGTPNGKAKVAEVMKLRGRLMPVWEEKLANAYRTYQYALERSPQPKKAARTEENATIIRSAISSHSVLNMRYKGLSRDIYPYAADGTYCVAYCTFRKDLRTFRMDRMENLTVGGQFKFDSALKRSAESRVGEAHTFHRY